MTVSTPTSPLIAILMGSQSDWPVMQHASTTLDELNVAHEVRVLSAHRTPQATAQYVESLEARGVQFVIAAAGGAAHLAGVAAAHTALPVLGVPMQSPTLQGLDSLLSTVQMPAGIPVATFAIGKPGAINAALFAVAALANNNRELKQTLLAYRDKQTQKVLSVGDPRQSA